MTERGAEEEVGKVTEVAVDEGIADSDGGGLSVRDGVSKVGMVVRVEESAGFDIGGYVVRDGLGMLGMVFEVGVFAVRVFTGLIVVVHGRSASGVVEVGLVVEDVVHGVVEVGLVVEDVVNEDVVKEVAGKEVAGEEGKECVVKEVTGKEGIVEGRECVVKEGFVGWIEGGSTCMTVAVGDNNGGGVDIAWDGMIV
jgi:hypothetical protein